MTNQQCDHRSLHRTDTGIWKCSKCGEPHAMMPIREVERLRAALTTLLYKDGDHWFTAMADGMDATHLLEGITLQMPPERTT